MTAETPIATVFVDPQCPFAWITSRWLQQVERADIVSMRLELMSLACVNEDQVLDPDYRAYNQDAWAAARVSAALLASPDAERWPLFYETYGRRRHVLGNRDNGDNLTATLRDLDLPAELALAADDRSWDADLRARTAVAVTGVDGPGGTPITRIGSKAYFGPVLTAVPPVDAAVHLWHALATLSENDAFASIATRRAEDLQTGG